MSNLQHIFARAVTAFQNGDRQTAERGFQNFLRHESEHFGALNLYAALLIQSERFAEAEPLLSKAIAINAQSDKTFYNYGLVLKTLGRSQDALDAFKKSLAINPRSAETWNNIGTVHNDLGQFSEAIESFDKAISLAFEYAEAYYNKGRSLCLSDEAKAGLAAFRQAASINPDMWEAWLEIGNLAFSQGDGGLALAAYENATRLKPDDFNAWTGKAAVLYPLERNLEAIEACKRALALRPNDAAAKVSLLQFQEHLCDWADYYSSVQDCLNDVDNFELVAAPFNFLSLPSSPAHLLKVATNFTKHSYRINFPVTARAAKSHAKKIKIAYLSSDFREHATSYLLAGVLEHHDRDRFEIVGFSTSPDQQTPTRQRIKAAFDQFHDSFSMSDKKIADLIQSSDVDIAVDLHGHTHGMRTGVFLRRPAPVQVNYLGFPGTMGAPFMDYIIGDKTVIPESDEAFYSEKIAWLPDTYQPNDNNRSVPELTASRTDFGLPADAFVFCCFNNTFKITPDVFDVWMRLLAKVENSVLWLLEANPTAKTNLRKEAETRGIAGDRLVFALRVSSADHLARHRLADLFLDTLYYNAHTTASDALWMGLPVLTREGPAFAGRVASSLLRAIGLPELVTTSLDDYEALALKLARDPALLASIKAKLAANRLTAPLFDTARYTRHLEAAYITMYERALRGEKPESFSVEPLPAGT